MGRQNSKKRVAELLLWTLPSNISLVLRAKVLVHAWDVCPQQQQLRRRIKSSYSGCSSISCTRLARDAWHPSRRLALANATLLPTCVDLNDAAPLLLLLLAIFCLQVQ